MNIDFVEKNKNINIIQQQIIDVNNIYKEKEIINDKAEAYNAKLAVKTFKISFIIGFIVSAIVFFSFANLSISEALFFTVFGAGAVVCCSMMIRGLFFDKSTYGMFDQCYQNIYQEHEINALKNRLVEEQTGLQILDYEKIVNNKSRVILGNDNHKAYPYIIVWNTDTEFSYFREMDKKIKS